MKPLLKVINLHHDPAQLIRKATGGNREAQNEIYRRYAPKMLSVCRSYVSDLQYAEDVMVTGFFKVFKSLSSYRNEGSFEGWIRRIMVRQCIDHLRKSRPEQFVDLTTCEPLPRMQELEVPGYFETELLQMLIDQMPEGYRTVFLMYAVEGYSHQEIAEALGISVSTSKTQLFKARKQLQGKLAELKPEIYEVGRI
ncbi:RNA polymerase sigma factor [Robertkochia flava]|uniref:RNA polymerase sigma factor n=1 Tax=Robertkochia flava TaxID=3447986 RepID=UPI001CCB18F8|nr:RNA polymerase sigma factor [Robertkochia marina]